MVSRPRQGVVCFLHDCQVECGRRLLDRNCEIVLLLGARKEPVFTSSHADYSRFITLAHHSNFSTLFSPGRKVGFGCDFACFSNTNSVQDLCRHLHKPVYLEIRVQAPHNIGTETWRVATLLCNPKSGAIIVSEKLVTGVLCVPIYWLDEREVG